MCTTIIDEEKKKVHDLSMKLDMESKKRLDQLEATVQAGMLIITFVHTPVHVHVHLDSHCIYMPKATCTCMLAVSGAETHYHAEVGWPWSNRADGCQTDMLVPYMYI